MFGLHLRDMQSWLNRLGNQIRDGRPLIAEQRRDGMLDGFRWSFGRCMTTGTRGCSAPR